MPWISPGNPGGSFFNRQFNNLGHPAAYFLLCARPGNTCARPELLKSRRAERFSTVGFAGFSHRIEMAPKSDRNRQIFAAFEAGQSLEQLGEYHGLSPARIHAVLMAEKHKRIISPEPFYRSLRAAVPT